MEYAKSIWEETASERIKVIVRSLDGITAAEWQRISAIVNHRLENKRKELEDSTLKLDCSDL